MSQVDTHVMRSPPVASRQPETVELSIPRHFGCEHGQRGPGKELMSLSGGQCGLFHHQSAHGRASCFTAIGFGRRSENESGVLCCEVGGVHPLLHLVSADGMGGRGGGGVAADQFLRFVGQSLLDGWDLEHAVSLSPRALAQTYERKLRENADGANELSSMGLTYAAAVISGDSACIFYQGDNKVMHIRSGIIGGTAVPHITSEETVGAAKVAGGERREHVPAPLFSQVTNYLGLSGGEIHRGQVEHLAFPLQRGDWLLGADDGLYDALCPPAQLEKNYVADLRRLAQLVSRSGTPERALSALRQAWEEAVCEHHRKDDNISVWVYRHG